MPFLAPALIAIGSAVSAAATAVAVEATTLALSVGLSAGVAAGIGNLALAAVPALLETGVLAGAAALIAPHGAVNTAGSPQDFKPNPNAGLPVVMGRYGVGGNLVYETTSGGGNKAEAGAKGNEYLTSFVILSALGPVQAFETLRFNDTILTFDPNGQACNGGYIPEDEIQAWNPGYRHQNADGSYINNNYQDHAWQNLQLGALNAGYFSPPDKLASDNASLPEWTNAHGFSGFCTAALTLVYDQRYYAGGVPQYQWVLQGIKTYDPRLDATYPGGAGAQRWAGQGASAAAITAARGTWTFSQNPWIHALNFALGHYLPDAQTGPGRLYAGIGAGVTGVDIAAFVRAANIADANTWLICGQWTTSDGKWSVLTEMAKAGSGSIVIKNGIISCIVDTPLTSLGTVTGDDLSGPISLPTGSSFTSRLNTIFPRFTSEQHRWQMVQADTPVKAATYVAEDGAVRSKTLDWQYVPAVNQACQLAAYTITNGREIAGIELPGKPKLRNYDVGDCFTVDIPEAGLATTKVMVTKRVTDWSTGGVTLTVRTETDAKHAYSLGISGVAPPTPGISGYDPTIVEAPLPANWATGVLEASDPVTGEARSIIQITGSASDNIYAKFVDIRWRLVAEVNSVWTPTGDGSWSYTQQSALQGQYPLDLNPGSYDVQIAYTTVSGAYPAADEDWLDLGVETVTGSTAANAAAVGDLTAKQINDLLDDKGESSAAIDANVYKMLGQISDPNTGLPAIGTAVQAAEAATAAVAAAAADADSGAIAVLSGIVDAANERASRIFGATLSDGTPVRTVTADSAEAISLLGSVEGGLFVLSDDTLTLKDGTKVATSIQEVVAAVDGTPTQPGLQAQITDLAQATTDTTNQTSIASKLEQVTATVDGADGTPALQAQITDLTQATTDETNASSIASKLEQVTAAVNGSGGTPSLQAQVTDLASATTDLTNGSSIASKLEAVTSTVDGADGAPSLSAQILDLKTATTDTTNGSSIASQLGAVEATVNGQGSTPSLSAQIATLKEATTDASNGSSLASLLETVTATVGTPPASDGTGGSGVQAQVYQAAQAAANANGKLAARLVQGVQAGTGAATVMIESDGVSGLIKLVADAITLGNTSDGSEIDVLAVIGDAAHFASPVYVGDGLRIDPAIPGLVAVNGSSQAIFGEGFGSAGNMILWTGPSSVSASQASRSNCYLCIDANGLYIPPSANTAVSSGGNAASASAGASWTDISSAPFTLAAQGYWLNPDGATDGYAASKPGAPANYASSGQTATGDLQIVERTSGQPDIVLGSAIGAITVTTDSEGSQITGSISLSRMTSTYTGSVELVLQARCTTTGRTLEGFPAGVGGTWTPKAS